MKKNILIGIGALIVALGLGFGAYSSSASDKVPNLSEEEIIEIVTAQYPGEIKEIELEKKGSQLIYEVEVENGNVEYEIKLDANTGEIIKISEKVIPEKQDDEDEKPDQEKKTPKKESKPTSEKTSEKTDEPNQQTRLEITPIKEAKEKNKSNQSKDKVIGLEKAIEIAQKEFKGSIKEAVLDNDDDRRIYEVEIQGDGQKAEFDIDAYTGEIISKEIEQSDKKSAANKAVINEQKAIEIALKEFSGTVTDIELDDDDGRLIYEIEVKAKGQEAEFEIDAYTGEIISIEIDD